MRSGSDRDGSEEEIYFDKNYEVDIEELANIFDGLCEGAEALTAQRAFDAFTIGFEIGMCHQEAKQDLQY